MSPADAATAVHPVQLAVWLLEGWMLLVTTSIIALSLIFLRHGADAEGRAPNSLAVLRAIIRATGGRLLLSGVRKSFPEMHDGLFVGPESKAGPVVPCWRPLLIACGMLAVMLMFSGGANAQGVAPSVGVLDDIGAFYVAQAKAMEAILRPLALTLFGLLSLISLALFFYRQTLTGDGNLTAFISRFAFEILKLGFFLWLVSNGPAFVMQFIGYFTDAGARVADSGQLSASGIVILGFDSCFRIFDAIGAMGWGESVAFGLVLGAVAIGILACFAAVGVLFLVRVIELHLIVYGGVLLLGFGGLSFTRDIPKNYLSYVISAGTQLFMLYVIVGLGVQLAEGWPQTLTVENGAQDILRQALQVLVAAAVFAALAWSIPKVAASLVTGSISLGAADVLGPAAAAAGGAATGTAVATGGASAAASTIGAAAQGTMQATSAGAALAREQGAMGATAALKGLGHAASAMRSEAGAAVKAKAGVAPPSPNAQDSRGRPVESLGTRAANRIGSELQATRETKASAPIATTGQANASASPASAPNAGRPVQASAGSAVPPPPFDAEKSRTGGHSSPLHPPQIPQDASPNSAAPIRFDTDD